MAGKATGTAPATRKAGTARNSKAAGTAPASPYTVAALPATGTQYRHNSGGTGTVAGVAYVQACRALAAWARGTANAPTVHALVHLGWCSGTGARATVRAANSAAYRHAAPVLAAHVGQPAAPAVVAVLVALAAAGAPAPLLATVWATYTGTAPTA